MEISLPERTYDVAAHLLAAALADAESTGESPKQALSRHATHHGRSLGESSEGDLLQVLTRQGFEPHEDGPAILLGNCPFHGLAKEYTELVCGMNQQLLAGVLDGLGDNEREAVISPSPGHCCVRISRRAV